MGRFRYRMQSILDIKEKLETQAKQEFAVAKSALDTELDKLQGLKDRKRYYENRAEELLHGTLQVQEIQDNKAAILKMDEYIELQKRNVKLAEAKLEIARQHLADLMQERKMHEKLREHAFEEFVEDIKKQESKEVDELTSYTYGQRIQDKEKQSVDNGKGEGNG